MAYVMLGRCEDLNDVFIAGQFKKEGIRVSPVALDESNGLLKKFLERNATESKDREKFLKISFLNVRSAYAHFKDVKNDQSIMDSDFIGLAETHLEQNFELSLQGYDQILANAGKGKGTASFFKRHLFSGATKHVATLFSANLVRGACIDVVILYLSQGFKFEEVKALLEDWISVDKETAILGDLNWHYEGDHKMKDWLLRLGFIQLIKSATHEQGSILDHVYINQKLIERGCHTTQHSVHFTDHDLITLFVQK